MIRRFKYIIRLFKQGNVCVCGLRGKGKDLIMGNVIVRRKEPYIANVNYDDRKYYMPLDLKKLDVGCATWKNFVDGNVPFYEFPYCECADVYFSDVGIYLPSQYCNEINKLYPYVATYQALSRQISKNNFHINTQNLNRCYDKIREQSDIYLWCDKLLYIPKINICIQKVIQYEKYDSAVARVKPARVHVPLFNKEARTQAQVYLDNYTNTHGRIRVIWLIYRNKSKHNTYYFKDLFERGYKNEK